MSSDDLAWATVTPKVCKHDWHRIDTIENGVVVDQRWQCGRCARIRDEARARLGKNNKKRGQTYEREWARRLGMRHTGGLNKEDDALNEVFVGQAKSLKTSRFPGWLSLELDKLRLRWPDRTPILGLLEAVGTIRDRKPRRLIVVDEADWIALHVGVGEEDAA